MSDWKGHLHTLLYHQHDICKVNMLKYNMTKNFFPFFHMCSLYTSGNPRPVTVWEHCSAEGPEHWRRPGDQTGSNWVPILLPLLSWRQLHQTQSVSVSVVFHFRWKTQRYNHHHQLAPPTAKFKKYKKICKILDILFFSNRHKIFCSVGMYDNNNKFFLHEIYMYM